MQVKFSSKQFLGGKWYDAGTTHTVSDKLMYTGEFRAAVRSGAALVLPRDEAAMKMQAQRDEDAHRSAESKRPTDEAILAASHEKVAAKWAEKAAAHSQAGDSASAALARELQAHHAGKAQG